VPWTMPAVISGFLATNSIMGSLLQIVQMIAVGLIYLPFLMMIDKIKED
jgi:PTS system cellobiose-specific IIC component